MNDAKQILEIIINDFSVDKFSRFFRAKSQRFIAREESYSHFNDDNFIKGQTIGEINFTDIDSLLICSFEVTRPLSERAGKKSQYEKAKNILKSTINQKFSAGVFVFYDSSGSFRFSLVYPESIGVRRQWNNFRRFTYFVSREFTNKTFLKQIGDKEFSNIDDIKAAFSITAVTYLFYKDFFDLYKKIVEETKSLNKIENENDSRDFVLLFTIRTIFLGFIQKKRWLGNDEKFIQNFYQEYKNKFTGNNEFYRRWLTPLFFEALNSPPGRKVAYGNNDFSKTTEEKLQMAPYLNGGLFKEKKGYDTSGWTITDRSLDIFFEFLFSHSFTIEENSLEDEDLQLNPEFLGIIFERLVYGADGTVYTPRPEVDLMCRLSLVKWLQKNLNASIRTENLYELFFKESEKEEDQKQGSFSQKEAQEVLNQLENLVICDPAVGSGAFLVGMMQVIDGVEQSLRNRYDLEGKSVFERKKQIIKSSLYGVEVKEWAVWICQLRLWLSLFVDAPDDLKNSLDAILPSLDFKVRKGDSLVQRVGSRGIAITADKSVVSGQLLKQLRELIQLKISHYDTGKPKIDEIEHREFLFYHNWIQQEITKEQNILVQYNKGDAINKIQQSLSGMEKIEPPVKLDLFQKEREDTVDRLEKLRAQLRDLHPTNKPFLWQLEFSEVFSTKGGFDIVIGNPPYVRQEDIIDPTGKVKDKKEYKGYLEEMVKLDFPDYFPPKAKINAQSDLYTYFYIRALRLLNSQGIHTFICSNSWLDVGYGVWLQEFLLNRCPVELIIDNHAKRSFESADVNTIISIIHAPQKEVYNGHMVKFIAFKKSFESAVFTENLIAIENAKEVVTNDTFRVYPISNNDLKEVGMGYDNQDQASMKLGKYTGDKWGGKYLRAPQFILNILKSSAVKPFKKLVGMKYGLKPGKVKFFYLTQDQINVLGIEKEFLYPAIVSSQDIKTFFVNPTHYFFSSSKSKAEMTGTNALKYINYGEANGVNKGISVESHRPFWYSLYSDEVDIIFFQFWNKRFFSPIASAPLWCSNNFCYGKIKGKEWEGKILVNSTFYFLQIELFGNSNQGQGILTTYMEYDYTFIRLPALDGNETSYQKIIQQLGNRKPLSIFEECGIDPKSGTTIEEQNPKPLPDRVELDNIVFDALKLSENERKDVYRVVCRLVWNRLNKAKSL